MEQTDRIIRRADFDAVIFDLDGVVTHTASVHAQSWKAIFDQYLQKQAAESGERFVPFDIERDYTQYVDGKPRYDGVRDFLAARGITLEDGDPSDSPDIKTVCGLGKSYLPMRLKHWSSRIASTVASMLLPTTLATDLGASLS